MFVDFLDKSAVEDALAKIGKSLGFSLKHGTLDVDEGHARVGSPIWWWYEYGSSNEEDGKVVGKVLLCHSGVYQDSSLKCYYIETALMLEDALATREFVVCNSRPPAQPRILNPFVGTRSLEELQIKLDLLGERKRESHGSK